MTVNTKKITSGPYTGNGIADTFSYGFRVNDKTELAVYETDDTGVQTLLVVDTDYTVNTVGNDSGGTITRIMGALPLNYEWYIRSDYDETQLTAFTSQGPFFPDIHEDAMDKLTFLIQQILDKQQRSPSVSIGYTGELPITLENPIEGLFIRWDSASGLVNFDMIGYTDQGDEDLSNAVNERITLLDAENIKRSNGQNLMTQPLDMGDNRVLRLPVPIGDDEPLRKGDIVSDETGATIQYVDDRVDAGPDKGEAVILWTGQSNSVQPWPNSTSPDAISSKAKIWNGNAFVQLAAGVSDIQLNATNHSLYNYTRKLIEEGGYSSCKIIMSSVVGVPIQDWVGTPADRTINAINTPRMQDIFDQSADAGIDKFTHIVTIQGEANFFQDPFPFFVDGTYGYDRVLLGELIINQGLADDDTKWLEVELLPKNVTFVSWKQNAVIALMDTIGRPNVYVVSTSDFVGYDEGLVTNLPGIPETLEYTLHFTPEENSELGNRLFHAEIGVNVGGSQYEKMSSGPDGHQGYIRPFLAVTSETINLSGYWAVGGFIFVSGVCDITLLRDALRGAQKYTAGMEIVFMLNGTADLTLTTENFKIKDAVGNRAATNTIQRTGTLNGTNVIKLVFTGSRWDLVEDQEARGSSGNFIWRTARGRMDVLGSATLGNNIGDSVNVVFPVDMPARNSGNYFVLADGGAVPSNKSTSGFTLTRTLTVANTGEVVRFRADDIQLVGF